MSGKHARNIAQKPEKTTACNLTGDTNGLYQRNITALRKRYPEVLELISSLSGSPYEMKTAHNQLPNIWNPETGFTFYDAEDPIKDVQGQLEALQLKNVRMAVFLGMGLGYEVFYYLQSMAPVQQTNLVLILEKDPYIFAAAMRCIDLTPLLENVGIHFMVGVPEVELFVRFKHFLKIEQKFMYLLAMKPVYHMSSIRLHKNYYLSSLKTLREAATHQVNEFGNSPEDSLIGVENMLANVEEIIMNPGINLLSNKFKGKPAVVVSTGPSLNKNKHLLKDLQDKALIIAADASLRVLINMGVKPHLVTALERTMGIMPHLDGFTAEQVEDVYLAGCPVIDNRIYQAYPGPRVIVYRNFDHFRWLDIDKGILNIQMSAGNMAFKIAEELGCDPIILIGQDLSFGADGTTHADGSLFTSSKEKQESQRAEQENYGVVEVKGNLQETVLTSRSWYNFLKAYEIDLAAYPGKCINSTEGGAYIQGTELMPFKEAIDRYIRDDYFPIEIIKENLSRFVPEQSRTDTEKTIVLIDETLKDMQKISANCKEGISCWQEYQPELQAALDDKESLERLREKIDAIGEEIRGPKGDCFTYQRTFQLFFAHIFQAYAIKFEMENYAVGEKYDDPCQTQAEVLLRQIMWYEIIGELAEICIKALEKARDDLQLTREKLA